MEAKKIKAAFFDRDGTLIKDVHYLSRLEDIHIFQQAIMLTKLCQDLGYALFMVTNQSGIARGFFDETFVVKTNEYLAQCFAEQGVIFKQCYYCPHHPQDVCFCRKPNPGMLLQAAQEHAIDLKESFMIGDKQIDLDAGLAAGCRSVDIATLFALSYEECAKLLAAQKE